MVPVVLKGSAGLKDLTERLEQIESKLLVLPSCRMQCVLADEALCELHETFSQMETVPLFIYVSATLQAKGIRTKIDAGTVHTPGWKYNHWEKKGVPLRIELGPRDFEKNQVRKLTLNLVWKL
jgi:prolyl-tRNA synthetase